MPVVMEKVLPMSPVHLLPMSPVYTPFPKGGIFPDTTLTPLWKNLEKRGRGDLRLLVRLRATLRIYLLFCAVDFFATASDVDPGVHPWFQSAIVGIAVE
jgi:hypothetical protein